MSNEQDDKLILEHDYDGIRELDNPLPGWWVTTFYGCVIFAIIYFAYYHFLGGPNQAAELESDWAKVEASRPAPAAAGDVGEMMAMYIGNQEKIVAGKAEYDVKCAACHGIKGEGLIGPNLTDNFWLHGAAPADLVAVISTGVAAKGMPAWEASMTPEQIMSTTAYILSLHGSNPPNAKAPEGEEVKTEE